MNMVGVYKGTEELLDTLNELYEIQEMKPIDFVSDEDEGKVVVIGYSKGMVKATGKEYEK
ncbi:MAG: hypothetical protein IH874_08100 [Candidatus Dadabacteria bacterium]|nr:hypothetical protein [Candidatus Dadabacteria bacterium]